MIAAALIAGTGGVLGNPLVWIRRALVVLVPAAPMRAIIAVPVTWSRPSAPYSRLGVLIKGRCRAGSPGHHRAK